MRLVGRLVFGKPRVAIDAEHGVLRRDIDRRIDLGNDVDDLLDQDLEGRLYVAFKPFFVRIEPVAVVVQLQLAEKVEKPVVDI